MGSAGSIGAVMGVINVTPDSFYAESRMSLHDQAIDAGRRMLADGASILDVGGESTRPGAVVIDTAAEILRVVPVIEALRDEVAAAGAEISIDTRHREVAEASVAAGATIINDVSASLGDTAAATGAGFVAMHMQGAPQTMQDAPQYDDVVSEVLEHCVARADAAAALGVERIWIDPGIGFGKTEAHNLALIAELDRFVASPYPVVLGASRKSFIGTSHARSDGVESIGPEDRLAGSLALATWAFSAGVHVVRTHDVLPTVQAAQVVSAEVPAA